MRQRDLPLELRVTVAQQALPFAHSKAKPDRPIKGTYGRSRTDVNEKIGPRVKVVKVNSDNADADSVTPLDFLLGTMRDADSQPTLRLRVARIVAPYVHRKGEPSRAAEAPVAMVRHESAIGGRRNSLGLRRPSFPAFRPQLGFVNIRYSCLDLCFFENIDAAEKRDSELQKFPGTSMHPSSEGRAEIQIVRHVLISPGERGERRGSVSLGLAHLVATWWRFWT